MNKKRSRMLPILAIVVLLCVAFYFIGQISNRLYPTQPKNIQPQPQNTPAQPQFSILKQWQPNNNPNGFGADILLKEDLSQEELVSFIKTQAGDKDPVLITVWTSQAAYDQNQKNEFGQEFKEGYIAFYVKNKSGQGAYAGFNEIRWMQEIGKFSSLYGQTTRF